MANEIRGKAKSRSGPEINTDRRAAEIRGGGHGSDRRMSTHVTNGLEENEAVSLAMCSSVD